jgi:hypothetical protein
VLCLQQSSTHTWAWGKLEFSQSCPLYWYSSKILIKSKEHIGSELHGHHRLYWLLWGYSRQCLRGGPTDTGSPGPTNLALDHELAKTDQEHWHIHYSSIQQVWGRKTDSPVSLRAETQDPRNLWSCLILPVHVKWPKAHHFPTSRTRKQQAVAKEAQCFLLLLNSLEMVCGDTKTQEDDSEPSELCLWTHPANQPTFTASGSKQSSDHNRFPWNQLFAKVLA